MEKLLLFTTVLFSLVQTYNVTAQITYLNAINSNKNAIQTIFSPDNKFAYVIATDEIQTYQRNPDNGHLTYLSSLTQMSDGTQLYKITTLSMSPDAKFIYTEGTKNAFIFSRDSSTGLITPFQTLTDGYSPVIYPTTNNNIAVSNDGKNIYIAGRDDLFIYKRDSVTGILSLINTIQNLNYVPSTLFEISILLSSDNRLAFITGGHSVSVYLRDTNSGNLNFKSIISGDNYVNQELTYAHESVRSSDDRFLYTVTNSQGSGALVVLSRDTVTDSLSVVQTFYNNIRPQYINISSDNKLICISSGAGSIGSGSLIFFELDSLTGKVKYISTYQDSYRYNTKKYIDWGNRYFYTCPTFTDSIYIHRFNLFIDPSVDICFGDSAKLRPWGNYISCLWSNGSTNFSIKVNTKGTYFLTVNDSSGNTYSDSIIVNIHQLPFVSLGNDTSLYLDQSIYLSPSYNYKSWEWNVNNNTLPYLYLINDSSFFGTKKIIVKVTDDFDCHNSDTILVTFSPNTTTVSSLTSSRVKLFIYPNPFSELTTLQSEIIFKNATLTLNNLFGQTVKQIKNIFGQTLTLHRDNLPNGLYFIRLTQDNKIIVTDKLVITN